MLPTALLPEPVASVLVGPLELLDVEVAVVVPVEGVTPVEVVVLGLAVVVELGAVEVPLVAGVSLLDPVLALAVDEVSVEEEFEPSGLEGVLPQASIATTLNNANKGQPKRRSPRLRSAGLLDEPAKADTMGPRRPET